MRRTNSRYEHKGEVILGDIRRRYDDEGRPEGEDRIDDRAAAVACCIVK